MCPIVFSIENYGALSGDGKMGDGRKNYIPVLLRLFSKCMCSLTPEFSWKTLHSFALVVSHKSTAFNQESLHSLLKLLNMVFLLTLYYFHHKMFCEQQQFLRGTQQFCERTQKQWYHFASPLIFFQDHVPSGSAENSMPERCLNGIRFPVNFQNVPIFP